ncbi:SGNH/GDSL hydrolase family protein [Rossellomorea aquimaris]|uniref:SGNH/GDSL hydrolase family protein n=1 Tax=Rossellomorea aquimaris TaxID=189382 RepID=UPI0005C9D7DA|nr:SGNH/GDSL hydrolase family protein [Rossellomorea aquimaris]
MKKVFIFFLLILCGGVIVYGNLHWKSMTPSSTSADSSTSPEKKQQSDKSDSSSLGTEEGEYLSITVNWPEDARSLYKEKLGAEEPFKIVLMGSPEMDSIEEGWNDKVADALEDEYGDTVSIESLSFETNTLEFVREERYEEVGKLQPGLVIFEPFVFKDNGNVMIEDSLQSIDTIMEEVKEVSPGASFALTPPQPIYQPKNYAVQVSQIQEYAEENDIPFIDHWSNWPDVEDEEIKTYLDDVSSPNEQGHTAWAKGIIDFLVEKE